MNRISLKCNQLEKRYLNKIIFKNVSFELHTGDSLAITGKNGSGKSTLLKVISGLVKQNKGEVNISYNGKSVKNEESYFHIGMLAPYLNLYEELTAYENLDFFYELKYNSKDDIPKKEYLNSLLEKVNLYNRRNEEVKNYSSGMKQRIKLAFSIINKPPILILDEPRTNLDYDGISIVYSIAEEQKKYGILIIATNESDDTKICEKILSIEEYKT